METKNVFAKLAETSAHMTSIGLKQNGKNDYANFEYFELDDFLPQLLVKCNEVGLFNHFNFFDDHAELTVINTDNPEDRILFISPSGNCNLKGCQEMQNIGGVETFQRRYLLTSAYGINSGDLMTKNTKNPEMYPSGQPQKKAQKKAEPKAEQKPSEKPTETPAEKPIELTPKQVWARLLFAFGFDPQKSKDDAENASAVEIARAELKDKFGADDIRNVDPSKFGDILKFIEEVSKPVGPEAFVGESL